MEYRIGDSCDLWLFLNNGHGVIKIGSNNLFNKFSKQLGEVYKAGKKMGGNKVRYIVWDEKKKKKEMKNWETKNVYKI